jgi:prepilin-type N-terminal cleavage/methylation domain-containing protein
MRTNRNVRGGREAFTLIELLVVIAIIGVLVGMTVGGVQRVRLAAKRAETASEVGQLASAVQTFLRDKKVNFIPSRIVLRERMDYDSNNQLEVASATYLKQLWPQIPLSLSPGATASPFAANAGIDWNNNARIDGGPVTLEGDQCLVFFLGGIPVAQPNGTYAADGFGKNPQNPVTAPRSGSTFEFKTSRLTTRRFNTNSGSQAGFPSYYDPYFLGIGEPDPFHPYAYYSSYGRKNGYNNGDCATLMSPVAHDPYRDTATTYYQPTGFQVISPGADRRFGVGGLAPSAATAIGQPDADNVTQFSNGQMSNVNN